MAVTNPTRIVRADSVNRIHTKVENHAGTLNKSVGLINTDTGAYYDNTTATVFGRVTNKAGVVTMAQTQFVYREPGYWEYQVPAAAWATGTGDWLVEGWVYGPGGNTDNLLATFYYVVKESNQP